MSDTIRDALMKAWENRPWKDQAQNPPSMMPQLAIALGLLHPRLGGATRDLSMARELAQRPGYSTAEFGEGLRNQSFPLTQQIQNGRLQNRQLQQLAEQPLSEPVNLNVRNPRAMRPDLRLID